MLAKSLFPVRPFSTQVFGVWMNKIIYGFKVAPTNNIIEVTNGPILDNIGCHDQTPLEEKTV
jgi:hypothetical protein